MSYQTTFLRKGEIMHSIFEELVEIIYIFPIIFITYLLIELVIHSHRFSSHQKLGTVLGSVFATIPTCSTNVIASELFVSKAISMGTLVSIFIASNDESIILLLIQSKFNQEIIGLFLLKFIYAIVLGKLIDFKVKSSKFVHSTCHHHHSIFKHVLVHSIRLFVFILLSELVVLGLISFIGKESLHLWLSQNRIFQPIIAGLVGFIPSCAGSILLSESYLNGLISLGSLFTGLSCSLGAGWLVLVKQNKSKSEVWLILSLIYGVSVMLGYII